jgi:SAM-dependent methyltransferase
MRRYAGLLFIASLLSCHDTPSAPSSLDGDSGPAAARLDAAGAALDDATIKSMSHALLDAIDRDDEAAFKKLTAPSFAFFAYPASHDRDEVASWLREDTAQHAPPRSRTYGDERVSIATNTAVFFGAATNHRPRGDGGVPRDAEGFSTIAWSREGDGLRAVHWQWVKGGVDADRERWNDTFRDGHDFTTEPSAFLREVVRGKKPGAALDIAMGQGRNAVFLASQGWRVTGVDISDEGLRIAREAAAARKLSIDAINADATTWDYGADKWDLIALIYSGCDEKRVKSVRTSLKRGGIVVVEGFHHDAAPAIGYETGALAVMFKEGFTVLRDETVEDVSDWGKRDGTREKLVHFVAQKL